MSRPTLRSLAPLALALALPAPPCHAQQAKSRAEQHSLPDFEDSLFFTIPPRKQAARHPLLVILPGGHGNRDFLPFAENGILGAAPADCVGVMVTATKWNKDQKIVWASKRSKVRDMKWAVEDHVTAIVADVQKRYPIDPDRIALLAWSSSGPVAYRLLGDRKAPFSRGYVAMSVWPKLTDDELKATARRRFVLDQSPDDQVTVFAQCRRAFEALDAAGGEVKLSTYEGGHGWRDAPIPRLRKNLTWLFGKDPAPAPEWPVAAPAKGDADGNLLTNPGFEKGTDGWRLIDNSGRFEVKAVTDDKVEGKAALHIKKTGGMPMDLITQSVRIGKGKKVRFSVRTRWKGCKNGWLKVWLYDADGKALNTEVNVARYRGNHDWDKIERTWSADGATMVMVQLIMVHGGEVWLDDASLKVVDE